MVWWNPDWTVMTKIDGAHGSYIFAAAHNCATGEVVTAGDEGVVKVWKLVDNGAMEGGDGSGGKEAAVACVESFGMPGEVYAVGVHQATGDLVVACTDGVVSSIPTCAPLLALSFARSVPHPSPPPPKKKKINNNITYNV